MSTPDRRRVWPAPDRLVRDPLTRRPIPAEGAEVEWSTYWERKLAHSDVVLTAPAAPETPPAPPAPPVSQADTKSSSKGA